MRLFKIKANFQKKKNQKMKNMSNMQKIESKNIFLSLQTSTPCQGRKLLIITTHFSEGMDGDEDSSRLPTRGVVSIIYAVVLLALQRMRRIYLPRQRVRSWSASHVI